MGNQKADVVAVGRLETRIDPRAKVVPVKPATPCRWGDSEVVPLRQDGPWDPRELLFVGLTSQLEAKTHGLEIHGELPVAQESHPKDHIVLATIFSE